MTNFPYKKQKNTNLSPVLQKKHKNHLPKIHLLAKKTQTPVNVWTCKFAVFSNILTTSRRIRIDTARNRSGCYSTSLAIALTKTKKFIAETLLSTNSKLDIFRAYALGLTQFSLQYWGDYAFFAFLWGKNDNFQNGWKFSIFGFLNFHLTQKFR